jgi:hypothetical protein
MQPEASLYVYFAYKCFIEQYNLLFLMSKIKKCLKIQFNSFINQFIWIIKQN